MDGRDLTAAEKKGGNGAGKYMDIWNECRNKLKDDALVESALPKKCVHFYNRYCAEKALHPEEKVFGSVI
ncbi:MAG: hypothetical protein OSJ72_14590 [Lachnospiraceae bacterium]|nr:hypothetical protein [Lachnospiraceae bacterium]